jgi:hypothetical protein
MPEALIADTGRDQPGYVDDFATPTVSWIGSSGSGPGRWRAPRAIAATGSGFLIADSGNHRIVSIDDESGGGWQEFGSQGSGTAEFNEPTGVAVDSNGIIYVADSGNSRIVRIDGIDGTGWTTYGTAGTPTPTDPDAVGKFRETATVAIDFDDQIWIADRECSRLVRISGITGTGWKSWPVKAPVAVGIDQPNSAVLVCALGGGEIIRRDASTGAVGETTPAGAMAVPAAVQVVGPTIFALDAAQRRVVEINDPLDRVKPRVYLADIGARQPVGMVVW